MNKQECVNLLKKIIDEDNIKIDEEMSKHTSFKIGGKADIFIKVDSEDKIIKILELKLNLPLTIIGNGTNLLVKDNGVRGIVLKYTSQNYSIIDKNEKKQVTVDAGMTNIKLAQILLQNELKGFEFASGIPGTIGGAIYMNAGAYGKEISEITEEVTYIDMKEQKIHTIKKNECDFSYRHSFFTDRDCIILNATFLFTKGRKNDIKMVMDEYREKRLSTQPLEHPNAGSTFKRGDGFITAKLIDEAGLKGYKIGGAEVSTKHAGFIINSNNATATDVLKLTKLIQKKIYEKFNKKIELEVRVIGEWKVFLDGLNQMQKLKDGYSF